MLFIPLNLFGSSSFDPLGSENYFSQEAQWARLAGPDFLGEEAQWAKMRKTDTFNSRSKWAGEDVGPIDFEQPSIDEMARALPKKPKSTFKMPAFKTKKEFEDTLISVFRTNAGDNRNIRNRRRGVRRTPAAATATERTPIGLEIQHPDLGEEDQLIPIAKSS